ncbi:PAS domain S-box protein [Halovenus marina]|uniref:PAS domain S-box protein n=1 Tax=Halovenus marina TaxID=3396621 RepID=UPI003F5633A3
MSDPIRVLHVDDDPAFRDMTATFLRQERDQFELVEASRGADARDRLREMGGEIDCIVSDYSLPDMNGVELLEAIRDEYADLPFILFTGKGSEAVARDALRAGATDYLQKQSGTQQYDLLANRIRNAIEQERTEQELEASRQRLDLFVEQSPFGVIRWDEAFNFARLNDAAEEILGYEESELLGQSWEAIVPESDRTAVGDIVGDLLEDGGGYHSINENVRKDGERIICEWHNRVVTDEDGTVVGIFSQFQNVTEREERQRRFEAVFNNAHTFSGLLEPDGTVVEVNETALSFGALDREDVVGRPLWETYWFHSNEARETAREAVEQASAGDLYRKNVRVRGADGEAVIDFSVRPVTDEHGEVTLLVPEGRNITEQERQRGQLEETTARIEALYENSPDLIDVLDTEGRLLDVNDRFCTELGYEKAEIIGTPIWELDRSVDAADVDQILSDFETNERRKFEGEYERSDGSTFPVEVHLLRLDLEGEDRFMAISRDITERKEQERKREQIISRVTDAIVEVDSDWDFTLLNDQAETLYDMREEDLLGRNFWDVFSQARGTRFEDEYRAVMETREPTSLVEYYPGLDGWFDIQVYPTDEGGVAFYFQEITERQRQQRRFEAVFNNTYQSTGFLDPDGTVLEVNDAALSFGGLDREEVVGQPFWETDWFQSSEARETARAGIEQARQGEMFRDEVQVQGADREAVIDFSVRPVTNEQGEVTSLIPEGRDITARKARERDLAASEARYRALAEHFPNGAVFLFDEDLRYQIVSGTGFDPIDISPEDLIGNTIYEIDQYSRETIEMLEPVMEATLAGNEETTELSYEGRTYRLRSVPIRDDEGEVISGLYITQDITEQREREAEIKRQNERLEQFASVVSHDLRNPLNMVEGRLQLAKQECESEELTKAETALDRCQTLVDDLLTLAREGQSVAETETFSVSEVLKRSWAVVATNEATLHVDTDQRIVADRSRVRQLLENLVRNAVDHGGDSVTVTVGALEDGFYVADDGPGIPEEIRDEVFESSYSTVPDNTGFGLAIVKEIVDAHGWDITVETSDAGGARFEITGVDTA